MKTLALIPARGGSKRIPRKNVKLFAGLPMLAHPIRAARATGVFERIVVSTDCPEIAVTAREHGAEVPFMRPAELADDFAGTDAVIRHALDFFADRGEAPERFCCIYATAPFVRAEDLIRGLDLLVGRQAATVFAATRFAAPIFRALRLTGDGRAEMFWPENFGKRSQDLPEAYHDAGQFYWGDTARYGEAGKLFNSRSVPVLLPRSRVQDIDTPEDWDAAERLYRLLQLETPAGAEVAR
jgi:N-acylneuraminate cytidylyltransferase